MGRDTVLMTFVSRPCLYHGEVGVCRRLGGNIVDETIKKLEQQDKKLDAIYASAEKTRKYLLWTLIITVAVIVVPLIGLPFAIPMSLSVYNVFGF